MPINRPTPRDQLPTAPPLAANRETPAEAAAKLIDMMSEELTPATATRGKR